MRFSREFGWRGGNDHVFLALARGELDEEDGENPMWKDPESSWAFVLKSKAIDCQLFSRARPNVLSEWAW